MVQGQEDSPLTGIQIHLSTYTTERSTDVAAVTKARTELYKKL